MPEQGHATGNDMPSGLIPSRNTEWETPFSPVASATAALDSTREAVLYSAQRRKVAIAVSVLALVLVGLAVGILVIATIKVGATDERRYLIIYYVGLLFWGGFWGTGTYMAWRWANQPLRGDEPLS